MKLTRDQALRFLQVAVGIDDEHAGKLHGYFSDLLGVEVPPSYKSAALLLDFLGRGDSREKLSPKDRSYPNLTKFVALLRALANALDPEQFTPHPAHPGGVPMRTVSEKVIDLDEEEEGEELDQPSPPAE